MLTCRALHLRPSIRITTRIGTRAVIVMRARQEGWVGLQINLFLVKDVLLPEIDGTGNVSKKELAAEMLHSSGTWHKAHVSKKVFVELLQFFPMKYMWHAVRRRLRHANYLSVKLRWKSYNPMRICWQMRPVVDLYKQLTAKAAELASPKEEWMVSNTA